MRSAARLLKSSLRSQCHVPVVEQGGDFLERRNVIRIKRQMFFKVRFCPDCGKLCFFARHPKANRCKLCRGRKHHKKQGKRRWKHYSQKGYGRIRKQTVAQGYCSLCGSTENLQCHHVGGGRQHYTCLCADCHQAYERWLARKQARLLKLAYLSLGGICEK